MKVLITGATGLLGKHLYETIGHSYGTWFTNSYHREPLYRLDINNKLQVCYLMNIIKPDVVIHCAAIGDVEYAEQNYSEVAKTNVEATKYLHEIAQNYKAQFIYISSNAVFDGNNPPYNEDSECKPINRYGSIKKQAEQSVMTGRNWLIIRPFMLYGHPYTQGRKNWYKIIFNHLIDGKQLKLVDDVYWQPTQAGDAAKTIWKLVQQSETEQIYNIAPDEKPMTLYEFGLKVAKVRGLNANLLEPVDSNYFPSIAERPVNTQYDVSKLKAMDIEMMKVDEGLRGLL